MNAATLELEFASRGVPYAGGLLLLQPDDAIALVRRAAAEHVAILGVDGLFVRPAQTISPIEHVADYSAAVQSGDGSWSAAERFVADRCDLGLVFEVVLGTHLDPAV